MSKPADALVAYSEYRTAHPDLFVNPPDAAYEIIFEPEVQRSVGAGVMYQDHYLVLLRDAVRFRDGSIGPYIRSLPAAAHSGAAVLPLLEARVVLIHHFRHATRAWHWEIPRGFPHGAEDAKDTARRELKEELNAQVSELTALGAVHPNTGSTNDFVQLYLARITSFGKTETYEGIDRTRLVTPVEFDGMVRDGGITDSFTLTAVLQARVRGLMV
jgi:ADP-ribose pyrophosphatase